MSISFISKIGQKLLQNQELYKLMSPFDIFLYSSLSIAISLLINELIHGLSFLAVNITFYTDVTKILVAGKQ